MYRLNLLAFVILVAMGGAGQSPNTIPLEDLSPSSGPNVGTPPVESTVTFVPIVPTTNATAAPQGTTSSISDSRSCYPVPVSPNTPTGIAGCTIWGKGIASHYGPGGGAAMNFCTWTFRHSKGCGSVSITSLDTGVTVVVPVVDFCDCYTGTSDERIIDLQWGVVAALGLNQSQGLYKVEVWPVN